MSGLDQANLYCILIRIVRLQSDSLNAKTMMGSFCNDFVFLEVVLFGKNNSLILFDHTGQKTAPTCAHTQVSETPAPLKAFRACRCRYLRRKVLRALHAQNKSWLQGDWKMRELLQLSMPLQNVPVHSLAFNVMPRQRLYSDNFG